jgi:hypothetical protein
VSIKKLNCSKRFDRGPCQTNNSGNFLVYQML